MVRDRRPQGPRWQSVAAHRRDPEPRGKRSKAKVPVHGGTIGPGGWRPDPSDPISYRYAGASAVGKYGVAGDATGTDSAHDAGGGAVGAADLEILFWGDYWRTATGPSTADVMSAMGAIVASPYLSALNQYGFSSLRLRGGTLVSSPGPPGGTFSADDVRNMVWALIDDDVFPEPDDGGGVIVYLVVAPAGTMYNDTGARGAHTSAHDTDLFDGDDAWVGWTNWGDLDFITDVLSHELIEALTDPLPGTRDAWLLGRSLNGGFELGDSCNNTVDRLDGLLVQAYWSEQDHACVIPWHRYTCVLDSGSTVLDTTTIATGVSVANTGPCQPPAPYRWWLQAHHQRDEYRLTTSGYANATYTWTLAGAAVTGTGTLNVSLDSTHPTASSDNRATRMVNIGYEVSGATLVVTNDPADGDYSYDVVGVAAESPKGSKRTTRTMDASGWIDGQTLLWEDAYYNARDACKAKMKAYGTRMVEHIVREIDKGDPAPPWVDLLPAGLRGDDRRIVQELEHLAHYVERQDPALAQGLHEVSSIYITNGIVRDGPTRGGFGR